MLEDLASQQNSASEPSQVRPIRRGLTVAALLFLTLTGQIARAAEGHAQGTYDETWRRATQSLALNNVVIGSNDSTAGVIQGTGTFDANHEWFRCRRGRGILDKQEFAITVVVIGLPSGGATVQVNAVGKTTWFQHHRIAFVSYGHVDNYASCESTGILENRVLAGVVGGAAR